MGESAGRGTKKKASAAQLRITKDINELELPKTCKTEFPDPDDLLNFKLIIFPDEGFYRHGQFTFSFKIGNAYPHEPPKRNARPRYITPTLTWREMCASTFFARTGSRSSPSTPLCTASSTSSWSPTLKTP